MALEKAVIKTDSGSEIKVLFNPNQISIDRGNNISEIAVPGLQAPVLQFVRGNAATLSVELFFDTYEDQTDVTQHTNKIYKLLEIGSKKVPPICTFTWGKSLSFRGLVDKVGGKYTLFLPDGTPVRATLSVTFKEVPATGASAASSAGAASALGKLRTVKMSESLAGIAAAELGAVAARRSLAKANKITNPRALPAGKALKLPTK